VKVFQGLITGKLFILRPRGIPPNQRILVRCPYLSRWPTTLFRSYIPDSVYTACLAVPNTGSRRKIERSIPDQSTLYIEAPKKRP